MNKDTYKVSVMNTSKERKKIHWFDVSASGTHLKQYKITMKTKNKHSDPTTVYLVSIKVCVYYLQMGRVASDLKKKEKLNISYS